MNQTLEPSHPLSTLSTATPMEILWELPDELGSTEAAAIAEILARAPKARSGVLWDCGGQESGKPRSTTTSGNATPSVAGFGSVSSGIAIVRHPEQLEQLEQLKGNEVQSSKGYFVPGTHCRQGDILQAVAKTGRPVWIERGSFLSPTDVAHVAGRFHSPDLVTIVEAGSHFGYDDRVLDPRALALYASWGMRVSLSVTELLCGDGAGSGFRPQWTATPAHREAFLKAFLGIRSLWNAGLVIKRFPTRGTGHATDLGLILEVLKGTLTTQGTRP